MVGKCNELNKYLFFKYYNCQTYFSLGLLKMLSQVLNSHNTTITVPLNVSSSTLSLSLLPPVLEPQNISNVVLALRTLGNFNFEGMYLSKKQFILTVNLI